MSKNIVRQDIVQIDFDIGGSLKEIKKLNDDIAELKKKISGGLGEDEFDGLKDSVKETVEPMKKVKDQVDKLKKSTTELGKKAATSAYNGLKKLAGISFKALTVGLVGAATAITGLVAKATSAFAEYQQLVGGVETLLGAKGAKNVQEYAKLTGKSVDAVQKEFDKLKASEDAVLKNANNAYKTAGISANTYMETVTSFSASLLQSLGGDTKATADLADLALRDMSDNANKMGTDMNSIIDTYKSLSRGNYAMLDNLKLGYGGTKSEMERLIKEASKLDKSVKANDMSFGNMVKAIHAVQENMGILGTTEKEATTTVSGSLNMLKASWENMLTAIGSGENLDQSMDNLINAVEIFGVNIIPVIERSLAGVGTVVEKIVPKIAERLPNLVDKLLPPLIKASVELVKGLIGALPNIVRTVFQAIADICGDQFPVLKQMSQIFANNSQSIAKFIPVLLGLVVAFKAFGKVKAGVSVVKDMFGKSAKGSGKKGSKGGFLDTLKNLAKTDTKTILKGMANLALIIAGFTVIAVALMAVSPYLAKIGDAKSLAEMIIVIGVVGVVGTALAKLGEIAGKIAVKDVALGLANIAIMIAGMTALYMLLGAVSLLNFDLNKIMKIVGIITVIGLVGTALSILAMIMGAIGVLTGGASVAAVALGLAGIAIMIAGIVPLYLLLGAVAKLNFNMAKIMQIIGIITVIGIVGTALSILAMIMGAIGLLTGGLSVAAIAIGLAGIAIMIAGIVPLYMLIGEVAKMNYDIKKVLQITLLIGVIGTLGTALSIFAAIVGLIPTYIVLAGLANMALVIGGVTALIIAFGKLSQNKNFNEFIEKGGAALVKVFKIIGEVVGSLVGGVAEGITNSLPKISENLSAFATGLKPMFDMFSGTDMSGAGEFLKAVGTLMLTMSGGKILDFFTGGTDFSGIAKGLGQLASEDVKKFLTMASSFDQVAFDNAKAFFEAMDGISNLPNVGGLGDLFGGKNDFSGVATGLGQLGGENVRKFFAMVAGLETVAFDNAKLFFECMDEVSSLPNVGGFGQLFSGKNDFSGVSEGLGLLGSENVKSFFTMVAGFDKSVFERTSLLFEALGDLWQISNGVSQHLSKKMIENKILSSIGEELRLFAVKAKPLFEQLQTFSAEKMNALWDSLKNAGDLTTINLSEVIDESIATLVDKISELPQKMGDALKNNSGSLSNGIVEMWKDAIEASVKPVNKLLDGANHILKEFGSKKRVVEWQPYAKGTGGHKGGNALVNDGRGAELVQMPNGRMFIPQGRNVFLPNAPKGMKVLSAENTARLLGRGSPTFRYAKGIGDLDVWSYYDNAKGLVGEITKNISYEGMSKLASNMGKGMVSTFAGVMPAWIEKLFAENVQSISSYVASKGVTQWLPTIIRALKMEGVYSVANVARTLMQMQTESGGNPWAINLWDSNAKNGTPSKGLMQVIDPTFRAYARAGFNKDIYDPLSNVLASVRYATARYGSLEKAYRGVGYSQGVGTISLPAQPSTLSMSYTPENSYGGGKAVVKESNTYAPVFNLTINGSVDDRSTERKVKQWISEAMDEVFDSMARKNPRLREV